MLPLFVFKEENSILVAAMVIYKCNFESENSIIYSYVFVMESFFCVIYLFIYLSIYFLK